MANYSLNQTNLIGRIGKDAPSQTTEKAPVKFSIVTERTYRDEKGENGYTTVPTWHNIVVWGNTGKYLMDKNLASGDLVHITGYIDNRKVQSESGEIKYYTDIVADSTKLVMRKGAGSANQTNGDNASSNAGASHAASSKAASTQPATQNKQPAYAVDDEPF